MPKVFGPYVLVQRIGGGGMAEIFLARRTDSLGVQRRVAIKRIHPELSEDDRFAQLLTEEATTASHLNNSRVVQVQDLGRADEQLYISMEYVEGWDLHRLLVNLSKSGVALAPAHALHIVMEVLRALDYAHRARDARGRSLHVVHRDVSPSNILVSVEGEVKLCDFGIARALHERDEPCASAPSSHVQQQVAGKLAYMAPELVRGEPGDERSDVYSAGIVLWELCAGRPLNRGDRETVRTRALEAQWPALPTRPVENIDRLQAIVDRALLPNPALRYASARDFLEALEDFVRDEKLVGSVIRFGRFLDKHFAGPLLEERRTSERAARDLIESLTPQPHMPSEVSGVRPVLGNQPVQQAPGTPRAEHEAATLQIPPGRSASPPWSMWAAVLTLGGLFALVYIVLSSS